MHRFRHLMVALAQSHSDVKLIQYAVMVARLSTVNEVRFVHVLPSPSSLSTSTARDRLPADLQAAVQPHLARLPAAVHVSYDVLAGPLVDCLLTHLAERQADLLLVGDRHGSGGRRSLVRRLAMKAPCSVWLVPAEGAPELRRLLIPIDFSDPSADALRVAAGLARLGGHTECLALHVYFNEAAITYDEYDEVLRGQELQMYERFTAAIDCPGVRLRPLLEEGPTAAHVIERVAHEQDVDAIVMATRGRSRSAAVLLGSVTEETILSTRVPLLAVKHFGARLGVLQALLDRRFWHKGGLHTD